MKTFSKKAVKNKGSYNIKKCSKTNHYYFKILGDSFEKVNEEDFIVNNEVDIFEGSCVLISKNIMEASYRKSLIDSLIDN